MRRQESGTSGDGGKQYRRQRKSERIGWRDAVEQARDQARRSQRSRGSDRQTEADQEAYFLQNHPQYTTLRRTQRHANPDFIGTACNIVRHDAVQSDSGEQQCQHSEETGERGQKTFPVKRLRHLQRKSLEFERDVAIHFGKRGPDGRNHILHGSNGAQLERIAGREALLLRVWRVIGRQGILPQVAILRVLHQAYDLDWRSGLDKIRAEVTSNRTSAPEELLGQSLIHDRDQRRTGHVAPIEIPARKQGRAEGFKKSGAHAIGPGNGIAPRFRDETLYFDHHVR